MKTSPKARHLVEVIARNPHDDKAIQAIVDGYDHKHIAEALGVYGKANQYQENRK